MLYSKLHGQMLNTCTCTCTFITESRQGVPISAHFRTCRGCCCWCGWCWCETAALTKEWGLETGGLARVGVGEVRVVGVGVGGEEVGGGGAGWEDCGDGGDTPRTCKNLIV